MKFSTRTTYGLRAVMRLAGNYGQRRANLPLKKIADEENISLGYLERIFARLKRAGLVTAEIGAGGGYRLARQPAEMSVFDIVRALEGRITAFHCVDEDGRIKCGAKNRCGATKVLVRVQAAVNKALKETKLGDLI